MRVIIPWVKVCYTIPALSVGNTWSKVSKEIVTSVLRAREKQKDVQYRISLTFPLQKHTKTQLSFLLAFSHSKVQRAPITEQTALLLP
jgi:hypothetical protein